IRVQLSMLLQAVISQQLVPLVAGGLKPAFEIMQVTPAIRNMVREGKTHQLETVIASSAAEGMVTMDASLLALYNQKLITADTALLYATHIDVMQKRLAQ
nr:type IV pili twitching motility protein PilT [bacterium]